MNLKKIIVLVVVAALAVAFVAFDLGRYLSLDYLKQSQAAFAELYARQPLPVALGFFVMYVTVTALSLPGAAILTLAGGAIFGLLWGTVIVSFASSLGAKRGGVTEQPAHIVVIADAADAPIDTQLKGEVVRTAPQN